MGDTFTLAHVSAICHAIADHSKDTRSHPTIIIGYDTRTGNSGECEEGSYTKVVVDTLLQRGINVLLCDTATPTPVISWAIEHYALDGGIILTASHNPANYNGLKFNGPDGAPANVSTTEFLSQKANEYALNPPEFFETRQGTLKSVNLHLEFAEELVQKVTRACGDDPIGLGHAKILVDARHGATANIWHELKKILGLYACAIINGSPLNDFGGIEPNPYHKTVIESLSATCKEGDYTLACAHDPDGDRHLIIDETGSLLTPEEITLIILDQLLESDCPVGAIATTLASSQIIKSAATLNKLNFYETKVGFKYFNTYLKQGRKIGKQTLAVESSGGFSTSFHTLEKCGYLPVVMILYTIAMTEKPLSELRHAIHEKYGRYTFKEIAVRFPAHKRNKIEQQNQEFNLKKAHNIFGLQVERIIKYDGCKIMFSNESWVLIRLSGTEPVARIYAESTSQEIAELLVLKAKEFIKNDEL